MYLPNRNPDTGIAYGVASGHSVPYLVDMILINGRNLTIEDRDQVLHASIRETVDDNDDEENPLYDRLVRLFRDYVSKGQANEAAQAIADDVAKGEFDPAYPLSGLDLDIEDPDECSYEFVDSDGNSFGLSYLGGGLLVWAYFTDTVRLAPQCSPCVPGAGDLDGPSDRGIDCYGIPERYLGDE